jgi:hypothetical protein
MQVQEGFVHLPVATATTSIPRIHRTFFHAGH